MLGKIDSKKGSLLTEEPIELILVVAGLVLVFVVLFTFYDTSFADEGSKTSKSYLDSLKLSIKEADLEGASEFFMAPVGEESIHVLAYFGSRLSFYDTFTKLNFARSGSGKNGICICEIYESEAFCTQCSSLDFFASSNKDVLDGESFLILEGERIKILKEEGSYFFESEVEGTSFSHVQNLKDLGVKYSGFEVVKNECGEVELVDIPSYITCTAKGSECKLTIPATDLLVRAWKKADERSGWDLIVTSGFRSFEEQDFLYQKYLSGAGPEAAKPSCDAPHQTGNAVDVQLNIDGKKRNEYLGDLMTSVGFVGYSKEDWHFECCGTKRYLEEKGENFDEA